MLSILSLRNRTEGRRVIPGVTADLRALNSTTEHSFLAVGTHLSGFLENVQEIIRQTAGVTDLFAGSEGDGASSALEDVLAHSERMRESSQDESERLNRILTAAMGISAPLDKVVVIVRVFRVLGTMIQIESARLESAGTEFGNLAEDVKSLTLEVGQQIDNIVAAAGALRERAGSILKQIEGLQRTQEMKLPLVKAAAQEALGSLREQRERAARISRQLTERFESSRRELGEVVSSLQFHDITRQQVEHVIEALEAAQNDPPEHLGAVARLQCAQLRHAGESFTRSVASIRASLSSIAGNVQEMAEESSGLIGTSSDDQKSFFTAMEGNLGGIVALHTECAGAGGALAEASNPLAETVNQMVRFAGDVQAIGVRMQRVALNASIRASHLGEQGAALETLAGAIQNLARDSVAHGEGLGQRLASIHADVQQLSENADRLRRAAAEAPKQLERMRRSIEELHAADQVARSKAVPVAGLVQRLANDVETSRAAFAKEQAFPERVEAAAALLDELADKSGASAEHHHFALGKLKKLYTMHSEREVHEQIESGLRHGPPTAEPAVPVAASAGDSDLGDNVELF